MAEDIKPEIIKKTQAALNKYIKKPPLTDKLLKKPPFRFLLDIVASVIKETGFLKDVFSQEELLADNFKDRDSKIKFLTKLINAVKDATGNSLKAKPGKIVAGLEADKTLELLQAIAKGISTQNNGKKATPGNQKDKKKSAKESSADTNKKTENNVKQEKVAPEEASEKIPETPADEVIKDDKAATEQPTSNGTSSQPAEEEVNEKKKKERRNSVIADTADETKERKRKSDKEERKREKEESRKRESFPPTPIIPNGDVQEENGERLTNGFSDEIPARRKSSSRGIKKGGSTESQEKVDISFKSNEETEIKIQDNVAEESDSRIKIEVSEKTSEDSNVRARSTNSGKVGNENGNRKSASQNKEDEENSSKKEVGGGDAPLPRRPTTRRASTRSSRQPMKALVEKDGKNDLKEEEDGHTDSKGETKKKTDKQKAPSSTSGPTALGSNEDGLGTPMAPLDRPRTARRAPPSARPPSARPPSARPRTARPPSALPGAPKARDRGNVEVDINKDQEENEIKEVAVITENDKVEDKEEMVVMENQTVSLHEADNLRDDSSSVMEGVLVDTILETQSELEKKKSNRPQVDIEWESGSKEKREAWQKECERLRQGVQALTRASGPLGKLFDFLQEDVDLAARELTSWRQSSQSYTSQLVAEERLTEETLSRHKKKLTELDALIEEQHDAIRSIKASIIANDKKIQALISRPSTTR